MIINNVFFVICIDHIYPHQINILFFKFVFYLFNVFVIKCYTQQCGFSTEMVWKSICEENIQNIYADISFKVSESFLIVPFFYIYHEEVF